MYVLILKCKKQNISKIIKSIKRFAQSLAILVQRAPAKLSRLEPSFTAIVS